MIALIREISGMPTVATINADLDMYLRGDRLLRLKRHGRNINRYLIMGIKHKDKKVRYAKA